jgi:hypothetical protein
MNPANQKLVDGLTELLKNCHDTVLYATPSNDAIVSGELIEDNQVTKEGVDTLLLDSLERHVAKARRRGNTSDTKITSFWNNQRQCWEFQFTTPANGKDAV